MMRLEFLHMAWTQVWQVTAVAAVIALLVHFVGRNRPHLAHALWLVVLAKCLTPPVWSSSTGIFSWFSTPTPVSSSIRYADHLTAVAGRRGGVLTDTQRSKPAEGIPPLPILPRPDPAMQLSRAGNGDPTASTRSLAWHRATIPLLIAWAIGATLIVVTSACRCYAGWRAVYQSSRVSRADLQQLVHALATRMRLRRQPRLWITAGHTGPAVFGIFRPTIVFPEVLASRMTVREAAPILAHELLHLRRGDLWIGAVQVLVQSLWWFHPLVWLANRMIGREAERCCDEGVIAELECVPADYARSLLRVLELKRELRPLPSFPGVRPVEVTYQRLERIMKLRQGCRSRTPWWCWGLALLGALVTLPGAAVLTAREPVEQPGAEHEARRIQIELTVLSGPSEAMAALAAEWKYLPVELLPTPASIDAPHTVPLLPAPAAAPPGELSDPLPTRAISQSESADVPAGPIGPAIARASLSMSIERTFPVHCAVITKADLEAWYDKLRELGREVNTESSPTVVTLEGQPTQIQVHTQRPFVVGMVPDKQSWRPQVRVVHCGWGMRIRPSLRPSGRVQLDCSAQYSDVERVSERKLEGIGQAGYTVQVPEIATSHLELCQEIALGKTLAIRGIEKRGADGHSQATLLLLRCIVPGPETNPADRHESSASSSDPDRRPPVPEMRTPQPLPPPPDTTGRDAPTNVR